MFELNQVIKVAGNEVFGGRCGVVTDVEEMEKGCYVQLIGMDESLYFLNEELEEPTQMEFFKATINDALANEIPFMYIVLKMEGFDDVEVIVNPLYNFEKKLEYYEKMYDENLKHKYAEIEIVSFGHAESMDFIEEFVFDDFDEFKEDKVETIFKVGDKVKIVKDALFPSDSDFVGKIGLVISADNEFDVPSTLVKIEGEELSTWFYDEELELIREFQVGDKVKIICSGSLLNNVGFIKFIDNDTELNIKVEINNEFTTWFSKEELELVKELQVGNKVRVVKNNHEDCGDYIGQTGTVIKTDRSEKLGVKVALESEETWFDKDELELI